MTLFARAAVRSYPSLLRPALGPSFGPKTTRQAFSSSTRLLKKRHIAPAGNSPAPPPPDFTLRYSSDDAKLAQADESLDENSPTLGNATRQWWCRPPDDPFDGTQLKEHINHIDAHWRPKIAFAIADKHFNVEAMGDVLVQPHSLLPPVDPPTPLRELAHVVPRGKTTMLLLVHDVKDVRRIRIAISHSPFNHRPRLNFDNIRELTVRLDGETREKRIKRIKDLYQLWYRDIRIARFKQERLIKTLRQDGDLLPDDYRKARAVQMRIQGMTIQSLQAEEKAWRQAQRIDLDGPPQKKKKPARIPAKGRKIKSGKFLINRQTSRG
ncbi:ribosome recycling factor [Ophiocordyceps camponoti-floridani]|uniref:Ribosome recycling factor n=1 Tax=Ophiocordyceps camponoti-floridani TaxID=2030778 RepID=A0A8H4QA64_9HYPO|nr:ribosome recycling factor [Ophiocordyceps camponoti-floridani]